jgi:hypothetical protein
MSFDTAGDDAFREVTRIFLKCLDAAGLENRDVIIVDRRGLDEDLFLRHRSQQARFRNAPRPFLAQLGAAFAEKRNELGQQSLGSFAYISRGWIRQRSWCSVKLSSHRFIL